MDWYNNILNDVNLVYYHKENVDQEYEIGRNSAGSLFVKRIRLNHQEDKICTDYVLKEELKYVVRIKWHRSNKIENIYCIGMINEQYIKKMWEYN